MERELIDAIGDYLKGHIERHGHGRTAAAFGVSRHTLWRFLERGQPGRALPRAVMAEAGHTAEAIAAATRALEGSLDEFWAEVDDGGDGGRTVTILRETGRPFELATTR